MYIGRQACRGAPLLAGVLGPADGLHCGSVHLGGLVLQQLRILFPYKLPVGLAQIGLCVLTRGEAACVQRSFLLLSPGTDDVSRMSSLWNLLRQVFVSSLVEKLHEITRAVLIHALSGGVMATDGVAG